MELAALMSEKRILHRRHSASQVRSPTDNTAHWTRSRSHSRQIETLVAACSGAESFGQVAVKGSSRSDTSASDDWLHISRHTLTRHVARQSTD